MLLDLWLARDGPAEGYAFVMDMEGLTMSHMTKVNIAAMRKNIYYVQVGGIDMVSMSYLRLCSI